MSRRFPLIGLLTLLVCILAPVFLKAQVADTVVHHPASTREEVHKTVTTEFQRWKDSMEAVRIKQNVARNGKPLEEFLHEMAEREKAEKRQRTYLIGLGVTFLTVLAVGLTRRRKRR